MKQKVRFFGRVIMPILGLFTLFGWQQAVSQSWDTPAFAGETPVSGTSYYVINLGASGFLNRGGDWGAEACVSGTPNANASTVINKWTLVNTSGSDWTFQYNNNGSNISGNFLFPIDDGDGWIFTDNTTNNLWSIAETDATDHIFSIQLSTSAGSYNASQFLGALSASRTSNKGTTNSVRYNLAAGDDYTKWIFVSQAGYELYTAKKLLNKYMQYAKSRGDIDLTTYISTYNAEITADINTAASNLYTALAVVDKSSAMANAGFESNNFTSWTNQNNYYQTQSNVPGMGWTKEGTYYAEKWTGSGGNLGDGILTQTITGLDNGLYQLVVNAHAVQQAGSNPLHTGAFITAGTNSTEIFAGKDNYEVNNVTVSNGSLTIGYMLSNAACNWTGFDNFRLYYFGAPAVSSDASLASISLSVGSLSPSFVTSTFSYVVSVPEGTTSVDVSATTADQNATINSGTGTISMTDGYASTDIVVTAEDGTTTQTYKVQFKEDCFSAIYASGNLVSDPTISDGSNFSGWGMRGVTNDLSKTYCGASAGYVADNCGGSFDYKLNNMLAGDKTYRLRAMLFATTNQFKIGIYNAGSTSPAAFPTSKIGEWELIDVIFTLASDANLSDIGLYFNACEGLAGTGGYIDNIELYELTSSHDIIADGDLKVYGDAIVNDVTVGPGGSITVYSGAALAIMGTATGEVTVERNTTGNGGYSIVGSCVSGADLSDLAADYLYTWNGSMWSNPAGTMAPGKGYFLGYEAASPKVSLTGMLVSGNQSVAVSTAGDGFNLVANPYAAAISITSLLANASNIDAAVYLWDDGGSNAGANRGGDYVIVNGIGVVSANDLSDGVSGQHGSDAVGDGYIGSMQGFFVHASADGNLDFTPAMQDATNGANADGNFYRNSEEQATLRLSLKGAFYNEVLFGFRADATEGADTQFDALKLVGNDKFAFYSLLGTDKYAIQGLPVLSGDVNLSLGYDLKEAGLYELSVSELKGIADSYYIYAVVNGKYYDLTNGSAQLNLAAGSGKIGIEMTTMRVLSADLMKAFNVYTNAGKLNVQLESSVKNASFEVYDLVGRRVMQVEHARFEKGKWTGGAALKSGEVYILRVQTAEGIMTRKFVF